MNGEGIATSLVAMIIVAIAVAGVGAYLLVTQMGEEEGGGPEEEGEEKISKLLLKIVVCLAIYSSQSVRKTSRWKYPALGRYR